MGFGLPSRNDLEAPSRASQRATPLMGFVPPAAHKRKESPRPVRPEPEGAPEISAPRCARGSRFPGYGAAPRLSQPLSGLVPLSPVLPFSGRWRSWGLSFRGLVLTRSFDGSSPPTCPLDVSPRELAHSFLGKKPPKARRESPRIISTAPLVIFRAFVHARIGPRFSRMINERVTDLPLLVFSLPMVSLPGTRPAHLPNGPSGFATLIHEGSPPLPSTV